MSVRNLLPSCFAFQSVLLVAIAGILPWPCSAIWAEERWVPSEKSLEAAERGENCYLYRTAVDRIEQELDELQIIREEQEARLQEERASVLECARQMGTDGDGTDEDSETLMAALCKDRYESWLHQGYGVLVTRQDIAEHGRTLRLLGRLLIHGCPKPFQARGLRARNDGTGGARWTE